MMDVTTVTCGAFVFVFVEYVYVAWRGVGTRDLARAA